MGINVSADLAFGVGVEAEESPWVNMSYEEQEELEDSSELSSVLVARANLEVPNPYDKIPKEISEAYGSDSMEVFKKWKADNLPNFEEEYQEYYAEKSRFEETIPVDLAYYGSSEYPCYVVYVKNYIVRGGWESPTPILSADLVTPSDEKLKEVADFCEKEGIAWGEPKWLLFGSMG